MNRIENALYQEDIQNIAETCLPWNKLENKALLIAGASGMIGSVLVDTIMYLNRKRQMNCHIFAVGRNTERARERFAYCWNDEYFTFISHDINSSSGIPVDKKVDFVLHLASNTHPIAYARDPIGTIASNIIGTKHLLDFAVEQKAGRFAFASSVEIYGENRGDVEIFTEDYCGYIDSNTLRAGYPESKRCAEALCQAYKKQKQLDIVILRLARTYGPTMLPEDSKAMSQFIMNGVRKEPVVLKSSGEQQYSYLYVCDAAAGILTALLKGKNGEAYNVADGRSDITLKELAGMIAGYAGTEVRYEMPEEKEASGYSKATKARMDGKKLQALGFQAQWGLASGIAKTLEVLGNKQKVL